MLFYHRTGRKSRYFAKKAGRKFFLPENDYSNEILMSPVEVTISHRPPEAEAGRHTSPVEVVVTNTFSERKDPKTSPVEVFTKISAASHEEKATSPVLRSMEMRPSAITFSRKTSPVFPVDVSELQETSHSRMSPVLTEISTVPKARPCIATSPVLVFDVSEL